MLCFVRNIRSVEPRKLGYRICQSFGIPATNLIMCINPEELLASHDYGQYVDAVVPTEGFVKHFVRAILTDRFAEAFQARGSVPQCTVVGYQNTPLARALRNRAARLKCFDE